MHATFFLANLFIYTMDIQGIREDFPTTKELNYLATCGAAPPLKPMLEAIKAAWDSKLREGTILCGTSSMLQFMEEGRRHASNLIGAGAEEIAFVRGNNDAMNVIASMLHWEKNDNVILNDMEYAGGVIPWMRQQKLRQIEIKCVKNRGGAINLEDIEEAIDENTKVISICHVHTSNGYKNNLEKLGRIAKDRGVYLVVNASQSLGAVEINVEKMNIDFITCSAYKWALGPPGTGLMFIRKELLDDFEPPFVGIGQEERSFQDPDFNYHEYTPSSLAKSARKFEYGGHQMATGIIGLVEALKYLDKLDIQNITRRNTHLIQYLIKSLKQLNVDLPSWIDDESKIGSHVGISTPVPAKKLFESLKEQKILTITRKGYENQELLRIAPHFFNTLDEIDELTNALSKIL